MERGRHLTELRRSSAASPVDRSLPKSEEKRLAIEEGLEEMLEDMLPNRHGGKLADKAVRTCENGFHNEECSDINCDCPCHVMTPAA